MFQELFDPAKKNIDQLCFHNAWNTIGYVFITMNKCVIKICISCALYFLTIPTIDMRSVTTLIISLIEHNELIVQCGWPP